MPVASVPNPANNLAWQALGLPPGREYATYMMVYDYADGYVVLFGGSNFTGEYMADTWTYRAGVWTELTPLVSPTARDSSGMAWDGTDNAVLLFGGYTPGTGGYLNDTWLFRAGTWTQLAYRGPTPRNGFGLTWDPQAGADLLFGGNSAFCANNLCNDTWEFAYGGWTPVYTQWTPTSTPLSRFQLMLTFNAANNSALMFGGYGGSGCLAGGDCGDTWNFTQSHYIYINGRFYDAGNWTELAPGGTKCGTLAQGPCLTRAPPERQQSSMAFDPADNEVVLFGGWNSTTFYFSDTWTFVGGTWVKVSPAKGIPFSRYGAPLAYDAAPTDQFLMMFGGGPNWDVQTFPWKFHDANWTQLFPAPQLGPIPTAGASMAYDPADQVVVYFGGDNYTFGYTNQTWTYHAGTWTQLAIGNGPWARSGAAMTWDPDYGKLILFGGSGIFGYANDTWGFVHGTWTRICAGGGSTCPGGGFSPPARFGAQLAYLPASSALVLFGGYWYTGSTFATRNDTWSFAGGTWANDTLTVRGPSPRYEYAMAYDVVDAEIVLFGGFNQTYFTFGDTWTLRSLSSPWAEVGSCGGPSPQPSCSAPVPSPRYLAVYAYDSLDQGFLVAEGAGNGYYQGGTFLFRGGTWYDCGNLDYLCYSDPGLAPYMYDGAAAYDAADGYTVVRGGFYGYSSGSNLPNLMYTYLLGPTLTAPSVGSSPVDIDNGQTTTLSAGATGGGLGTLQYSWDGIPGGCTPPSAGIATFSCTPLYQGNSMYSNSYVYGTYWVPTAVVTDSNGWPSIVTPDTTWGGTGSVNVAPDLSALLNASTTVAEVGQTVYVQGTVEYDGWGPYTWYWQGFPSGCSLAASSYYTELLKCVLPASDVGQWQISVGIVDSTNSRVYPTPLTLTVYSATTSTAVTVSRANLDVGQSLSFDVTASGGSGSYSYVWTHVPAACASDAPVLSCTVPSTEAGSYTNPTVNITDTAGVRVTATYAGTIVVAPDPTASALGITNRTGASTSHIDTGQTVTFTLTSTPGSGGDTILWSGLPNGCTPANSDSTSVSCAPNAPGTYDVSATLNDSNGGSAVSPLSTLVVAPALGAIVLTASQSTVDIGETLVLGVSPTGGSGGDTFSWSGLPPGCVATNAPTLSCLPTGTDPTTVHVTLTDSNGAAVAASLSVTVNGRLTSSVSAAVSSSTAPGAATFTAVVGGGTSPFTFEWLRNGSLVAGATTSTYSVSELGSGTYSIQLIVGDATNATATSSVASLTVAPPPPAPAAAAPFATSFQWLELGLLAALLVLAVVLILIALRRSRGPGSGTPPPTAVAAVSPPAPPPAPSEDPNDYHET